MIEKAEHLNCEARTVKGQVFNCEFVNMLARQGLFPTILLHFLHPWRSDVLTCMDALMPRTQDAEERPDNPVHFHHLDNCSCVVLTSSVPAGRLAVKPESFENNS